MLRKLKSDERKLLNYLLCCIDEGKDIINNLGNFLVEDMKDGGMGSVRFHYHNEKNRRFNKVLLEKKLHDVDGTEVIVSINVDNDGILYELDIWKVDFSPVKKILF